MTDIDLHTPSAVNDAIEQNLFDLYDEICRLSRTARYEKRPYWRRLFTGIHHPICNSILSPRLDADHIDEQIGDAMVPFRGQIPMLWWVGPSAQPADLALRLIDHGLIKAGTVPGMAAELTAIQAGDVPDGLVIRRATTPEEFDDWSTVFATVFELSPEARTFFDDPCTVMAKQQGNRFMQLTGYFYGKPVACGTFFISAGAGGAYNIGTIQEARGKGIGSAVMSAGADWFRHAGMDVAILQSSSMGFNVYERLGFRHCCDFRLFTNNI